MKDEDRGPETFEENKRIGKTLRYRGTVVTKLHKTNDILETESILKRLLVDIEMTRKVIGETKKGFADLRLQLEAKTDYKNKVERELRNMDEKRISLKAGVYQLEIKIDSNKAKISEIECLKDKIPQSEAERDSIISRTKALEPEIPALLDETVSMQSKIEADTEELHKRESEKQRLDQNIYDLNGRFRELGDLEEKKKYLASALGKNHQLSEKIAGLSREVNPGGQTKSEIEADIRKMEGEIKRLDNDIDDLMSEGDSLSKAVIPEKEIDNLQTSLNNAENKKDDIKARIVQSQKTLEGHLREKGEIISAVEEVRPELETIRNDFTAFRDKIELYEKHPEEMERLKDRKPELEKQAQGYLKRTGIEQEELKHLNVAVDIINTELNTYKQAMQQISDLLNI